MSTEVEQITRFEIWIVCVRPLKFFKWNFFEIQYFFCKIRKWIIFFFMHVHSSAQQKRRKNHISKQLIDGAKIRFFGIHALKPYHALNCFSCLLCLFKDINPWPIYGLSNVSETLSLSLHHFNIEIEAKSEERRKRQLRDGPHQWHSNEKEITTEERNKNK